MFLILLILGGTNITGLVGELMREKIYKTEGGRNNLPLNLRQCIAHSYLSSVDASIKRKLQSIQNRCH